MFSYPCPYCGDLQTAPADHAGERTLCTKCLRPVVIPDAPVPELYRVELDEPIPLQVAPSKPQPHPAFVPARRRSWSVARFVAAGLVIALAYFGANAAARYFSAVPHPAPIQPDRAEIGPVANFRSALSRRDAEMVVAALHDLAQAKPTGTGREFVLPELKRCLSDVRPEVRTAALAALVTWSAEEAKTVVKTALCSIDGPERRSALKVAARFPDPAVAAAVAARLPDRSDRAAAAQSLVTIGEVAVPAVAPMLASDDLVVVLDACDVLGQIGGPEATTALSELARTTTDPLVRAAAERALKAGR